MSDVNDKVTRRQVLVGAGAAALGAGAASGSFTFSDSVRSPKETFMVCSVDSVMRCTSSA